jgi:hypothetical protein
MTIMGDPLLSFFALGLLIFVVGMSIYETMATHDIPYLMAKSRNYPHTVFWLPAVMHDT